MVIIERGRDRQRDRNRDRKNVERNAPDVQFGDENVDVVDSEWADYEKFISSFRRRRISVHSMEEELRRPQRPAKVQSQAFYPCPPPTEHGRDSDSSSSDEDDPFGYMDTLVSIYTYVLKSK